jgi:hypothetical protein
MRFHTNGQVQAPVTDSERQYARYKLAQRGEPVDGEPPQELPIWKPSLRALPPRRRQGIDRNHAGPDTRFGM